ncbi:hypothetical protein ACFYP4_07295 [Streptomyces sp. NPDC005551]|uniref:hypothetical protein n=1 Tax=Streptomyces sp. NPDC005551 TaxID=3364725 RepID=UPI0036D0FB16
MPGPETASQSAGPRPPAPPPQDTAGDVVRWAAFSCVLVPVVLVLYGTSLAGAAGTALGLGAVTAVCRMLLRESERGAARPRSAERFPHRGRHGGEAAPGVGPARSGRGRGGSHAMAGGHIAPGGFPGFPGTGGAHGKNGSGAHRGARRAGGNTPVD